MRGKYKQKKLRVGDMVELKRNRVTEKWYKNHPAFYVITGKITAMAGTGGIFGMGGVAHVRFTSGLFGGHWLRADFLIRRVDLAREEIKNVLVQ